MMPKVSVLIPAYNVEPYLRECLDSVLHQTLSDFEVLCVNDASTDGTPAILREYEEADARIRVFCQEKNLGQSAARNLALAHASGEYVYMLDADDRIVPEALQELTGICSASRLDVVGFRTRQFTEISSGTVPDQMVDYEDTPVMNGREALTYCMNRETFSLSVPTFFIRRGYLKETGLLFREGILHEDVGYVFSLIVQASRIRFLDRVYFERRLRASSTMTGAFTAANIEGYLQSFLVSFEMEKKIRDQYGEDETFTAAVKKWQRDIFARLRQLYLLSEETVYAQEGGTGTEEIRRLFEVVKLTAPGRAQAEDILGKEIVQSLEVLPSEENRTAPEVYVCGTGAYTERAIGLAGALDLVIGGILVTEKTCRAFRGFPVWEIEEAPDRHRMVLVSVSHYRRGDYERRLKKAGFSHLINAAW